MPIAAEPLLYLTAGIVLFAWTVYAFVLQPKLGVVAMAAAPIPYYLLLPTPSTSAAGVAVTLPDVVFSAALVAALVGWRTRRLTKGYGYRLVLLLAALCVVALLRGIPAFGLTASVNEARGWFYFFSAVVFGLTFIPRRLAPEWLAKGLIAYAALLSLVAVVNWLRFGLGDASSGVQVGEIEFTGRGLPAGAALVVAQAGLVLLVPGFVPALTGMRRFLLAFGFLGIAVVLQHRSVWVVVLAALAAYLILQRRLRANRLLPLVVGVTAAGALFLLFETTGGGSLGLRLSASYAEALAPESTLTWRLDSWAALVSQEASSLEWVMGRPFGGGFQRQIDSGAVDASPHNTYVEILLRTGLLGLVLLLSVYAVLLLGLRRAELWGVLVLVASQAVFVVAYRVPPEQGLVVALAVVLLVGAPPRESVKGPSPPASRGDQRRLDRTR